MARRGIRLPYDGRNGAQQVGQFETADPESGAALYQTITLTTSSGTGEGSQVTITQEGRYTLKADIDFHIETLFRNANNPDDATNAPDVTTSSPLVESGERIVSFFPAGTRIKARRSGGSDGTLWITPN